MKKIFTRQRRAADELNMAPLIDMIFILLIFFLVTTSFVKEAGVEVHRPVASSAKSKEKTNLIVHYMNYLLDVRSLLTPQQLETLEKIKEQRKHSTRGERKSRR